MYVYTYLFLYNYSVGAMDVSLLIGLQVEI